MLQGKRIVITGAGRGIGAACAERAARLGAAVVINDISRDAAEETAAAIRAQGGNVIASVNDITKWEDAGELIATCVRAFGGIDGLVNNAGLFHMARIEEMTPEAVFNTFAVNVAGASFCASHAAREMMRQRSGAIVNIVSGAQMGIPAMGVYGASKGALATLTYVWAQELQEHGIWVNAVAPLAETRMVTMTKQYQSERQISGFAGTPPPAGSNAPAVCFLLSDHAKNVTGQVIRIEGTQLGLVSHPLITHPVLEREIWDEKGIDEAFTTEFKSRLSPLGYATAIIQPVSVGSDFLQAAPLDPGESAT